MRIARLLTIVIAVYITLLLSGYGILIDSSKNVVGWGLQCKYLTARTVASVQYVHSSSGIIGTQSCPLFKKLDLFID